MVIDDSLAVRRVVEATFARVGMDAVSFPDGMTALNALASGATPVPDVLLLDIGLPKMDGYEVAKILRTNPGFHATPIIMLTGRDGKIDRLRSKFAGARDFVAKPFRPADLVAKVREYLHMPPPSAEM
jgi:DNA-binding response OmpR family regulator